MKNIDKLIETFFEGMGYNLKVKQSDEFAYYSNGLITYTLHDTAYNDIGFAKYIRKHYKNIPECSLFTLSLLHELGHHITMPTLNRKKWRKAKAIKKKIENVTVNSMEKAIAILMIYSNLYDERIATDKAIELLKKNYKWVLRFEYFLHEELKNAGAV